MFIALLKTILGTSYFVLCSIQTVPAETLGSEEMGKWGNLVVAGMRKEKGGQVSQAEL